MTLKTAILVFANTAEYEARLKPFSHSKEVFEVLNLQTIKQVQKTGVPYFLINEKQQIGKTFGERFTNAIQSVYNLGYDAVITIGNDTPHLKTIHLKQAIQKLQKNDFVIGPSMDGGFYLLGIKKEYFNANLFLELPWQTQKLNTVLAKRFFTKTVKVSCLEKLIDIDVLEDINKIVNSYKKSSSYLFKLLLQIVIRKQLKKLNFLVTIPVLFYSNSYNKGSPQSI